MDRKNSHERPKETPPFDELNFSHSPSIETFLQQLRAGQTEKCLALVATSQIRLVESSKIDDYQAQILRQAENARKYEQALQAVKAERDTLLGGVYHIYKTFSFVFQSIEEVRLEEEGNKQAGFLAKALQLLGLKNVSPAAISVMQSIINHLRRNMDSVTQNVEQLAEKLSPSLDILIKHQIVATPKPPIDSSSEKPAHV